MVTAEQAAPAEDRVAAAGASRSRPWATIEKVSGNVYLLTGEGGNTAIYVAANGVVLVDTKVENNGQAILDQVRKVTDKPITHIINTHTHFDHTGSNQFFPATVEIVVQENTAANMRKMPVFQDAANKNGLAGHDVQGQEDGARRQRTPSTSTTSAPRTRTATRSWCSVTRR